MSCKSTTTSAVDIVTLLYKYESLHEKASKSIKDSFWNITKARRGRGSQAGGGGFGGLEYSADDVREQLRARAILEILEEGDIPQLVEENDDLAENSDGNKFCTFRLHFDGMKQAEQLARIEDVQSQAADIKDSEGLRRRVNANSSSKAENSKPKSESEAWIFEEHSDEEERLRNADPLFLFGVPPPALRAAQGKSRDAIAYYVEVANLAREILKLTERGGGI